MRERDSVVPLVADEDRDANGSASGRSAASGWSALECAFCGGNPGGRARWVACDDCGADHAACAACWTDLLPTAEGFRQAA